MKRDLFPSLLRFSGDVVRESRSNRSGLFRRARTSRFSTTLRTCKMRAEVEKTIAEQSEGRLEREVVQKTPSSLLAVGKKRFCGCPRAR